MPVGIGQAFSCVRVNGLIADMATTIKHIKFRHYKALENYALDIDHINILTGSNNSGKSTVLGSLRVLAVALRTARTSTPQRISVGDSHLYGYRIKESLVPISLENVATNYIDGATKISFQLTNGNSLDLIFDRDVGCVLVPETLTGAIRTTSDFKKQFPIGLTVIPVLGPVEHKESIREIQTVTSALSTHRASRHFRNYWHHFPEGFDEFSDLVERTWPGMKVQHPEINNATELTMFVSEDRIDRELYWVGFGFQIWCQLLTHLHRADPSTMIVIDEPEVYLHPDIQRRLLKVLKDTGAAILVATHSIEIISQAVSGEVVHIDKRKKKAEREEGDLQFQRSQNGAIALVKTKTSELSTSAVFAGKVPSKSVSKSVADTDSSTAVDNFLVSARAAQQLISAHTPIDASEDWDEINLEPLKVALPDMSNVTSQELHGGQDGNKQEGYRSRNDKQDSRFFPSGSVRSPKFSSPSSSRDRKMPSDDSELTRLLLEAKAHGIEVDDQRGKPGGRLFTSLREEPDEVKRVILTRLVDLGLQIWPGKHFLK